MVSRSCGSSICAIILGLIIFGIGVGVKGTNERWTFAAAPGSCPGSVGLTVISALGRYGTGAQKVIPDWLDLSW